MVIEEQFRGPPGSANGGYACSTVARWVDGPAEVTLRVPPPLGRELTVVREEDRVSLPDGELLVAEARPTVVDVEVPEPVSLAEAERAAARCPWRDEHPYPTCFVCGPQREAGGGLYIFPGPVEGCSLFAAPWTPSFSLAGAEAQVRAEFVWGRWTAPAGSSPTSLVTWA